SRRRHTRSKRDWSSDVCSSDLEIPVIKTDLSKISKDENVLVWFGHSSYFIQIDGKRILVDPVFCGASPVSFVNKPFKGADAYKRSEERRVGKECIARERRGRSD